MRWPWRRPATPMRSRGCWNSMWAGCWSPTRRRPGRSTLLWDGLPAHRSRAMRAWLGQRSWLVVERLPGYAPELNPVEGLWSSLKAVELANLAGEGLDEVIAAAERGIQRIRGTHHLAFSFL